MVISGPSISICSASEESSTYEYQLRINPSHLVCAMLFPRAPVDKCWTASLNVMKPSIEQVGPNAVNVRVLVW